MAIAHDQGKWARLSASMNYILFRENFLIPSSLVKFKFAGQQPPRGPSESSEFSLSFSSDLESTLVNVIHF